MPTPTYDLIEEKVLGSAASSVTFSSIPQTFKDLLLEIMQVDGSSGGANVRMQFNSDTATNYSETNLYAIPQGVGSVRSTNLTYIQGTSGGYPGLKTWHNHIMSYTSTNVYKTVLQRMGDTTYSVSAVVGLWRKTPEAITSITLTPDVTNGMNTGSTFRLWGIA